MKSLHLSASSARSFLCLLVFFLLFGTTARGQSLFCNDLVQVSLDDDCLVTIDADQILEGGPYCYPCLTVEIDKTPGAPNCNGPWLLNTVDANDIGKTYCVRVKDPVSGNACWCNLKILDNTAPTLTCPSDVSVGMDAANCYHTAANGEFDPAAISDNCSTPTLSYLLVAISGGSNGSGNTATLDGVFFNRGTTLVRWKAVDASANIATCTFTVQVSDNIPPTITCPNTQQVGTNLNQCSYTTLGAEFDPSNLGDNCPGFGSLQYVLSSGGSGFGSLTGTVFPIGSTTVTWTVTDNAGNTTSCSFNVIVKDNLAPKINCPGNLTRNTDFNQCSYSTQGIEFDASGVGDNCPGFGIPQYVLSGGNGSGSGSLAGKAFPEGLTTVTWTVTDAAGNPASCSFTVKVKDNQPPTISCPSPSPQTRNTKLNQCSYTTIGTEFDASGLGDNCPSLGIPQYVLSGGLGSGSGSLANKVFPKGTTTVTWTVTDASGNPSTCSFAVTVNDMQAPTISCPSPSPLTRNTNPNLCSYTTLGTEFDASGLSDNCPSLGIPQYVLSGGLGNGSGSLANKVFPKGTTTVTWTVTDASGNPSTCSFAVTVNDMQAPKITCPGNLTRNTDLNQCIYTTQGTEFDASGLSDNCPGLGIPQYLLSGGNGSGSGSLAGKAFSEGLTTVTWTVTDAAGNPASCSFLVKIKDIQPPVFTKCYSDKLPLILLSNCKVLIPNLLGTLYSTATDNCPGLIKTQFPLLGSLVNAAHNQSVPITITAKDVSGNTSTCVITAVVTDLTPPTITTCPPNRQVPLENLCEIMIPDLTPELIATDCTLPLTVTQNPAPGTLQSSALAQSHYVSMTVTDGAGNATSCTVKLTAKVGYFAYVANVGSDNVSVINTATNTVVTTIPVGNSPLGVSSSKNGKRVYVTNSGSGTVSVINTYTNAVISTIGVDPKPYGICINNNGSRVYVAHSTFNGSVSVINTTNNSVATIGGIGDSPVGICVSNNSSRVYVANYSSHSISVINAITNLVTTTIPLPSNFFPIGVCLSSNGSRLFVSGSGTGQVAVINTISNTVLQYITVGAGPRGICMSPNGQWIYVANYNSPFISVIDALNYNFVQTIISWWGNFGVSITPDGKWLYAANLNGAANVFDTQALSWPTYVVVGYNPYSLGNFISAPTCLPPSPSPTEEGDESLDDEIADMYEPAYESVGLQAFPNPFTDNLTVSFNLNTAAQVGLALFDLAGREVFQESSVDFDAGPQSLTWNTEGLPQGVYLVGLKVDGGVWQYQKAMLVR